MDVLQSPFLSGELASSLRHEKTILLYTLISINWPPLPRHHPRKFEFGFAGGHPVAIEGGDFQINYEEPLLEVQARYMAWLERVIVEALTKWRQTL